MFWHPIKSRLYLTECKKLCENETYFGGLPSFADIPSIGKIKEGLKIKFSIIRSSWLVGNPGRKFIKPKQPQPNSFQDKPGLIARVSNWFILKNLKFQVKNFIYTLLIAIPHDNNKTISEIPYFLFHIETSYDFDSTIWKSGGYPIPTEAWRTQLDDEISMMEPKIGQKGSKII